MGSLTCKVRHFIALVISVTLTSMILSIYNQRENRTLQDIVTQTHRQFETLKENIQASVESVSGGTDKLLELDDKYLRLLGFIPDPTTNTNKLGLLSDEPHGQIIIVTAVDKTLLFQLEDFLASVQLVASNPNFNPVVVWNVDSDTSLEEDDDLSLALRQMCNSTLCMVKRFNFEDFPDHVKDLSVRAYRPLILQMMLDARQGCSLWLDVDRRFIAQNKLNLSQLFEFTKDNGIMGWPSGHPTSSLTHPKMFPYFESTAENFIFHRMIEASQLLLCKTDTIEEKVMKPWAACSLTKECIAPFGAQSTGCRFDKKPLYRYSGCHAYDAAALNVALGVAFPGDQSYISRTPLTKPVQFLMANATTTA